MQPLIIQSSTQSPATGSIRVNANESNGSNESLQTANLFDRKFGSIRKIHRYPLQGSTCTVTISECKYGFYNRSDKQRCDAGDDALRLTKEFVTDAFTNVLFNR